MSSKSNTVSEPDTVRISPLMDDSNKVDYTNLDSKDQLHPNQ
jgi:hypothetical protein